MQIWGMSQNKEMEPFLIELLIRRYSWFIRELNTKLEASGGTKLSRAQIIFLFYLEDGKDRVQTMSEKLGLSKQAVSLTAHELVKAGIITLEPDPAKKSAKLIKKTTKGKRSVEYAFRALHQLEDKIAKKIGSKKLAELKDLLQADWD